MLEGRVVRYAVYSVGFAVGSEAVWQMVKFAYCRIKNGLQFFEKVDDDEDDVGMWKVAFVNSKTGYCDDPYHNRQEKRKLVWFFRTAALQTSCPNRYCPDNNIGQIIKLIDNAKYSIDLAMFIISNFRLAQALLRARERGVLIRVIGDMDNIYTGNSQGFELTSHGIPIRFPKNRASSIMHHKFCVFDSFNRIGRLMKMTGKNYDTKNVKEFLLTGSLNWTAQGVHSNFENVLITTNKVIVNKYDAEFQEIWDELEPKVMKCLALEAKNREASNKMIIEKDNKNGNP